MTTGREVKPLLDPCEDAEPGSSGETQRLYERSDLVIAQEKIAALEAVVTVLTAELDEARKATGRFKAEIETLNQYLNGKTT